MSAPVRESKVDVVLRVAEALDAVPAALRPDTVAVLARPHSWAAYVAAYTLRTRSGHTAITSQDVAVYRRYHLGLMP